MTRSSRRQATQDTQMRGPCFYCRRPMNWTATPCPDMCRWCLGYLASGLGGYAIVLRGIAKRAAIARGERLSDELRERRFVEKAERLLGRPLPKVAHDAP